MKQAPKAITISQDIKVTIEIVVEDLWDGYESITTKNWASDNANILIRSAIEKIEQLTGSSIEAIGLDNTYINDIGPAYAVGEKTIETSGETVTYLCEECEEAGEEQPEGTSAACSKDACGCA